ncbi:hypothetical protein EVAR_52401_1 [Eumeta japonica]|uniref:Uncharacterized protein n=1 Tax=Eumeta variegata TaxID=151549 RepID=A0A4C1Z449_EUMVA|nr:hypothetical protein EVAR_52401_1 [Eumeta japonica]
MDTINPKTYQRVASILGSNRTSDREGIDGEGIDGEGVEKIESARGPWTESLFTFVLNSKEIPRAERVTRAEPTPHRLDGVMLPSAGQLADSFIGPVEFYSPVAEAYKGRFRLYEGRSRDLAICHLGAHGGLFAGQSGMVVE